MGDYRRKSILILFIFSWSLMGVSAQPKKVTLTTHNLSPYGSFAPGSEHQFIADESFSGFAVDVVRCAAKKINWKLEVQVYPWARAQDLAQRGKVDGFFAGSQKDSRDDFAVMSEIIAEQKWQWYQIKDSPIKVKDKKFKKEAKVGRFIGSNMLSWLLKNSYSVGVKAVDTEALLKILLIKRVDAVIANNLVMDQLLKKYKAEDKVEATVVRNKPLGVYFTKKFIKANPMFLGAFNKAVKECRK